MGKKKLTTLADLSKEFKLNKSQLKYYLSMGLLKPIDTVGSSFLIFDYVDTKARLRKIFELKEDGKSLFAIQEIFKQQEEEKK